ncbi:MAG: hypothetical protein ACPG77_15955, partial [Nannocystaceae bacterium]
MSLPLRLPRLLQPFAVLACVALIPASGCKSQIGSACLKSIDCSLQGERTCDLSHRVDELGAIQPDGDGECTIEGCSQATCPSEAKCVSVYATDFLSIACNPDREDRLDGTDDCRPHEICLSEGLCADAITARTSCRRECNKDSNC